MKRLSKLRLLMILTILLLALTVTACNGNQEEAIEEEKNDEGSELVEAEDESDTIEIVDMADRRVEIPSKVETIATPNVDAYRILVQLDAQDKLIGVPSNMYGSKYSEGDTIEVSVWPEVKNIEKVGGGPPGTEVNAEVLMDLNPDVIISWSYGKSGDSVEKADDLQKKTGIPVICLNNISTVGSDLSGIEDAYTMLGKIAGKEEEAEELLSYYKEEVASLEKVMADLPEEEVKDGYLSSVGGILRATNNYLPMMQLRINNVAEELGAGGGEVSREQLIAWNPEIIFIHTPSPNHRYDLSEIEDDPALKDIAAIESGDYYRIKGHFMGWDVATGLTDLVYMAKLTYPEHFEDIDMYEKGNEILKKFYKSDGLYDKLIENSDLHEFK